MDQKLSTAMALDETGRHSGRQLFQTSYDIDMLADYIANVILPENPEGFTIDPVTIEPPGYDRDTFIVSLKGREQRFIARPQSSDISGWINLNKDALFQSGHYIGGWRNKWHFFLDVSIAVQGRILAFNAARANQQLAIYHPSSGQSFYVPYDLPRAA